MKKTLLFLTTFLVALSFIACTKNNTDIDEGIDDDIDMSLIDFSNIELLFGQSLPVVQKCMEGKWKLIRISSGWDADKFPNDGEYMIISNERIIMGNDTDGIKIDSPVIWEKLEKYYGNLDAHFITYNHFADSGGNIVGYEILFPLQTMDGTLFLSDFICDGFTFYYTKY